MKRRVTWVWTVILLFLITVSLYMTYIIIVRPSTGSSIPTTNQSTIVNTNNKITNELTLEQIFRPTQFVYYQQDKFEITSDQAIVNQLNANLVHAFKDLSEEDVFEQHEYEDLVLRNSQAQLLFDTMVPFAVMTRYFDNVSDHLANRTFTRIVFDRSDQTLVYFINDQSKEVYKAVRSQAINELMLTLYDEKKFYEFQSFVTKKGLTFVIDEPIQVTQYTFLAEQLPTSYYIETLYSDTSELKNRSDTKMNIYNDALSQLEIDRTTNILSYFKNQPPEEVRTLEQVLNSTFSQYRKFENWKHGISYLWGSSEDNTVEYIRYLYNYPVFGSNKESIAKISTTSDGLAHLRFSISTAVTPLEIRNKTVKLSSGTDVVSTLLGKAIDLTTIEDIRIGYEWRVSSENSRLLEFVPKWFIKKDNRWQTLEALVAQSHDAEQGSDLENQERKEDEQ